MRSVFEAWYGNGFYRHYSDIATQQLPSKVDVPEWQGGPLCIYGHFDKSGGSGVEKYYPDANQFITMLRDPFETAVSTYFTYKKLAQYVIKSRGLDVSKVRANNFEVFLLENKPNILNQFPRAMNTNNFRDICEEYFIEIGITEKMHESMQRIANKLEFKYSDETLLVNETRRDELVPCDLKEKFMELNKLEYEVYNYCLSKF